LVVHAISVHVREAGVYHLINELDLLALKQLTSFWSEDDLFRSKREGVKNSKTKNVIAKRLFEAIRDEYNNSIPKYVYGSPFEDDETKSTYLKGLLNFLGADSSETEPKKLAKLLVEETEVFCLRTFLTTIPAGFLRVVCSSVRIRHGDCSSSNILADCLIYGKDYEAQRSFNVSQPTLEKKPKKIRENIPKADLMHWFTAKELKDFCDENNLKSGGKKSELAERILNFFDPEKENDLKGERKKRKPKGRKKKASRTPAPETNEGDEDPMEDDSMEDAEPVQKQVKKGAEIKKRTHEPEPMSFSDEDPSSEF